jgi:hypothetical protein
MRRFRLTRSIIAAIWQEFDRGKTGPFAPLVLGAPGIPIGFEAPRKPPEGHEVWTLVCPAEASGLVRSRRGWVCSWDTGDNDQLDGLRFFAMHLPWGGLRVPVVLLEN